MWNFINLLKILIVIENKLQVNDYAYYALGDGDFILSER